MAVPYAHFERTEYEEAITRENHPEFLYHLQQALLLALQEQGRLRIPEYRRAEENLLRQSKGPKRGEKP